MLALPLRLPTAPYGGHMGHFLLSVLILTSSTPLGDTCARASINHARGANTLGRTNTTRLSGSYNTSVLPP